MGRNMTRRTWLGSLVSGMCGGWLTARSAAAPKGVPAPPVGGTLPESAGVHRTSICYDAARGWRTDGRFCQTTTFEYDSASGRFVMVRRPGESPWAAADLAKIS